MRDYLEKVCCQCKDTKECTDFAVLEIVEGRMIKVTDDIRWLCEDCSNNYVVSFVLRDGDGPLRSSLKDNLN